MGVGLPVLVALTAAGFVDVGDGRTTDGVEMELVEVVVFAEEDVELGVMLK